MTSVFARRLRASLRAVRGSLVLLAALVVAGACASDDGPYAQVENWECFEDLALPGAAGSAGASGTAGTAGTAGSAGASSVGPSCDCYGLSGGEHATDPRLPVSRCTEGWLCCYAWPNETGNYDCRCEDVPSGTQVAAFCASAASERGGEVVDGCPPTPRNDTSYCAFDGESCEQSYLQENGLNGCCSSLSCK
ncbi:MAG TPA: hypothetical protein VGP93_10120, partial [Polyangiaceae bacterium]|nr:hypothetical protein [Polyangiaceae bacterium]